jgi:hypothetical protein
MVKDEWAKYELSAFISLCSPINVVYKRRISLLPIAEDVKVSDTTMPI